MKTACRRFAGEELPRALSVLVGNTRAAAEGFRRLDDQPDYNRVWPGAHTAGTPEHEMARQVVALMRSHRQRLAEAPPEATSRESIQSLERRLELVFRRHPLSAAAGAAYVCLMQLDLQRLRGLLAVRALRDAPVAPP